MASLRMYRIEDKYIRYLKSRDSKVQDNKDRKRPYVGVVLKVGSYQYFVPLESPKPNHAKIKPGKHIMKIDGGKLGLMGFNNMIPVHIDAIEMIDINAEPDQQCADLLRRQVSFINNHKSEIYSKANDTYYDVTTGKNKFLMSICCDFKKLEYASDRYNPLYKCQKKKSKANQQSETTDV